MTLNSASEAERQADRLRRDLGETLDQIADNLSPARLAANAVAVARDGTPDWLVRYWTFAQSPAGIAIVGGVIGLGVAGALATRRRGRRWPRR